MPPALKQIINSLDRAEVQREIDELRSQIEAYEALLAAVGRFETNENGEIAIASADRVSLSRKREVVRAILRERPGAWTTGQVRDALTARGIDPDAGTPVKNVLWHLAKRGEISAAGSGVYEFSALNGSADHVRKEALAA